MADSAVGSVNVTPVRRRLGTSTDDAAIFFEDTVDRATAQCIDASPSALALLTPQRLPASHHAHVDVTEYDASHLGSLAGPHRRSTGSSSGSRGRLSGQRSALHDVTNTSSGKGTGSKSPTPKAVRCSEAHTSGSGHHQQQRLVSLNSSLTRSTPRQSTHTRLSPAVAEPMVPLAEFEALQRERNRFEKMYEHQRALYEEMAEKQAETYQTLQDKIIEVVALSTRNEESKRFIRQLKREFSESRTRVMEIQNKAMEEAKAERNAKSRYEALIQSHERRYERLAERHETKLAGMESLVKDLTCLRGEQDQLHVSQLDSLLKAAYAKSTALFSDLLRQGRQIDLLYDAKADVEAQLEQLRREKRETEAAMRDERRRGTAETERMIEQIEEQQQSILNLRQMLIRTMDNRDNVFAYSRGPRRGHEDEDTNSHHSSSSSSSFSSAPPSPIAEDEEERSFGEDDDDAEPLHRDTHKAEEKERESAGGLANPLTTALRPARSGAAFSRPVISAAATPAAPSLASNAVVVRRGTTAAATAATTAEVPPLPLSSRVVDGDRSRVDASYRIQRTSENGNDSSGTRSLRGFREEPQETAIGGVARVQRPQPAVSAAARTNENVAIENSEASPSSVTLSPPSASGAAAAAAGAAAASSRRRLDFTSALAAVTEKRRRDRVAREGGNTDLNATLSNSSNSSSSSSSNSIVGKEPAKENSSPVASRRVIVRSCAVGSIATARPAADGSHDEDEEEEPRLFPRSGLRMRE